MMGAGDRGKAGGLGRRQAGVPRRGRTRFVEAVAKALCQALPNDREDDDVSGGQTGLRGWEKHQGWARIPGIDRDT